jgi:hypothetical protein
MGCCCDHDAGFHKLILFVTELYQKNSTNGYYMGEKFVHKCPHCTLTIQGKLHQEIVGLSRPSFTLIFAFMKFCKEKSGSNERLGNTTHFLMNHCVG